MNTRVTMRSHPGSPAAAVRGDRRAPGPRGASETAPRSLAAILLIVAAVLCFANTLANGFALDDRFIVAENAVVRGAGSALVHVFSEPYWGMGGQSLYGPLTALTYRWNFLLGGAASWSYHAVDRI